MEPGVHHPAAMRIEGPIRGRNATSACRQRNPSVGQQATPDFDGAIVPSGIRAELEFIRVRGVIPGFVYKLDERWKLNEFVRGEAF